jgi:hypothetical protein
MDTRIVLDKKANELYVYEIIGSTKYSPLCPHTSKKPASSANPLTGSIPEAGNQCSTSGLANVMSNKVASQKLGTEYRTNKTTVVILSNLDPLLTAALIPSGILTKYPKTTDIMVKKNDQNILIPITS